MIKLIQRFPNFFSGFTSEIYTFSSLEDLNKFLDNPPDNTFVYRWKSAEDFVRFEITRMHRPQKTLLVHLKDSYWAIAFIKEIDDDS